MERGATEALRLLRSPMKGALLVAALVVAPITILAQGAGADRVAEHRQVVMRDPDLDLQYRGGAVGRDHDVWMVVTVRAKASMASAPKLQLRRLSCAGQRFPPIDLELSSAGSAVAGVVVDDDRVMLVERTGMLRHIDTRAMKIARSVRVEKLPAGTIIASASAFVDHLILVVGSSGDVPWAGLLDSEGDLLAQQRYARLGPGTAVAASNAGRGGTTSLVGFTLAAGNKPTGWAARIGASLSLEVQVALDRPPAAVSSSEGGRLFVLEEEQQGPTKNVWLEALGSSLQREDVSRIAEGARGLYPFAIGRAGSRVVVAGYTSRSAPMLKWRGAAESTWSDISLAADRFPVVSRADVLADSSGAVALFGLAAVDERGEQRLIVRAIELSTQ